MWKWTNPDDIRVIILDSNYLEEYVLNHNFEEEIENVIVCKVDRFGTSSEAGMNKHTGIYNYFDISSLLNSVMHEYNCDSDSIIAISGNIIFLKEMMQNHIGTILSGSIDERLLRFIPDFTFKNEEKLIQILDKTYLGYGAEVMASESDSNKKSLIYSCAETILDSKEKRLIDLYIGGRYCSFSRHYFDDDPLSVILRRFKYNYLKVVDLYYDKVIYKLNKDQKIDILTYVPLKPKEISNGRFDRFNSLDLVDTNALGISLQRIIKCNRDFIQKGKDIYTRQRNVRGAYELLENVKDKNVVVLDDLYTSGSTIKEIGRILYENGAKKVTAILLAVNQMTESTSIQYQQLTCPHCGKDLILKVNRKEELFFGCINYMSHSDISTTLSLHNGLKKLKNINKLKTISMGDLDDEY